MPITPAEPKVNVSDLAWACAGVPVPMPNNSVATANSIFIADPFWMIGVPDVLADIPQMNGLMPAVGRGLAPPA